MPGKILVIDDEEKLRSLLKRVISLEGFEVSEAGNLKNAYKLLDKEAVDVILCDVKLPDGNGVDFVTGIRNKYPLIEIILLTAYGNIPDAIQAMKNGAFDYITKGDDNGRIIPLLNKAFEKVSLQNRILQLETQVSKKYNFETIIGNSENIKNAVAFAKKVAPTDATVLLLGETGTGKEVFAQAIHNNSRRIGKPFVAINCSAFSKELLESELFGHLAGAFTGATKDKKGLLEEANSGTIFLDEVGEMHIDLQAKMLRVLETTEFFKVGDTKPTKVSVRIIAATNRDLKHDVEEGKFREDLFYRLNVFTILLPALRERKEDIPLFAEYYLVLFNKRTNGKINKINPAFTDMLLKQEWKGNVRELKNVMERAVILADGNELNVNDLPLEFQTQESLQDGLASFELSAIEKLHIQRVLNHTKGNKTETARLLNIGLTTLYRKMEEYNIS